MVKLLLVFFLPVIFGCASKKNVVPTYTSGIDMNIGFSRDSIEMGDSVGLIINIVNGTDHAVLIDSSAVIKLKHYDGEGFIFYENIDNFSHRVYQFVEKVMMAPKQKRELCVKLKAEPGFFRKKDNKVYAVLLCWDHVDWQRKRLIRTSSKICISSEVTNLFIREHTYNPSEFWFFDK